MIATFYILSQWNWVHISYYITLFIHNISHKYLAEFGYYHWVDHEHPRNAVTPWRACGLETSVYGAVRRNGGNRGRPNDQQPMRFTNPGLTLHDWFRFFSVGFVLRYFNRHIVSPIQGHLELPCCKLPSQALHSKIRSQFHPNSSSMVTLGNPGCERGSLYITNPITVEMLRFHQPNDWRTPQAAVLWPSGESIGSCSNRCDHPQWSNQRCCQTSSDTDECIERTPGEMGSESKSNTLW